MSRITRIWTETSDVRNSAMLKTGDIFFGIEGNPKSPVYREIEQVMLPPFKCSFGIHRTRIQAVNARSTFSTL